jgi:hypothetical protein
MVLKLLNWCKRVNIENNHCNFTLGHPLHPLLAAGAGFNISATADLAYSASFPVDWFYIGSGVQIHWGGTHAALQNCEGIIKSFVKWVKRGLAFLRKLS